MSDFSLTLVLHFKTSKNFNGMAKLAIKSEKLSPFGGIFSIMEQFDSMLSPIIDQALGQRCRSIIGYQYSEIVRSLMSVYFCGGSCVEDVTSHLMRHLSCHPMLRTCSSDTILIAIRELTQDNISYTSDQGKTYDFNTADKLNALLIKALISTGELNEVESYDVDFDHQFFETENELYSILVEKWEGKCYRLVIQRQRRTNGDLDLWEGEYTYHCILTNDYDSSTRDIVEFYNKRGGKERIFDDMNNGFGWNRLPKSFMAENTVFLLLTAIIRNFYKFIMARLDVKRFGLKATSRIKAFVFKFISVPAKWVRTSRQYVLNIYSCNKAYADVFQNDFG